MNHQESQRHPRFHYNYRINMKNFQTLPKYNNRDVLIAHFGSSNLIRIDREHESDANNLEQNSSSSPTSSVNDNLLSNENIQQQHEQQNNKIKLTTKIKLAIGPESTTRHFAQWWSEKHNGLNFFTIKTVQNVEIGYEEPWIGFFHWTDNPCHRLTLMISIKFNLASIQCCDFDEDYSYKTYHPVLHLIFETYLRDHNTNSPVDLIDCYSADVSVKIPSTLYRIIGQKNFTRNSSSYEFNKYDQNWKERGPSPLAEVISKLTKSEELPIRKFLLKDREIDENNVTTLVRSPNIFRTLFETTITNAIPSCRQMSFINEKRLDLAMITAEPFEIMFDCISLAHLEIILIKVELVISDPCFDNIDINHLILDYISSHPNTRRKFFNIVTDKTCFGEHFFDYNLTKQNPLCCVFMWIPRKNCDPARAHFEIKCTKEELLQLRRNSWIKPKIASLTKLSDREEEEEEEQTKHQTPLRLTLNVTYSSFSYGTIFERHTKEICIFDFDQFCDNLAFEPCYIHDNEHSLKRNMLKACIFRRLNDPFEHFVYIDGRKIPLTNKEVLWIHDSSEDVMKSEDTQQQKEEKGFILSLSKNYHIKRKHPNDSTLFEVMHYPDIKKSKKAIVLPSTSSQTIQVSNQNSSSTVEIPNNVIESSLLSSKTLVLENQSSATPISTFTQSNMLLPLPSSSSSHLNNVHDENVELQQQPQQKNEQSIMIGHNQTFSHFFPDLMLIANGVNYSLSEDIDHQQIHSQEIKSQGKSPGSTKTFEQQKRKSMEQFNGLNDNHEQNNEDNLPFRKRKR